MKTLVQLTDCHVGKLAYNTNLTKIVSEIVKIDYDAIIITGDLTENGLLSEYLQLQMILNPLQNIFVLAGNHDSIINMKKVFSTKQLNSFVLGEYYINILNSKIVNKIHGCVDIQTIKYKKRFQLILATHHAIADKKGILADDFLIKNHVELLTKAKEVKAKMIIFGHTHMAYSFKKHNIDIYSCPSSAYQFNTNKIAFNIYKLYKHKIKQSTSWI